VYHADGSTWVYTNPGPLEYVREAIEVDRIQADVVILAAGPPSGTSVVVVGAAELHGVEAGVGGGH
jgi:hypothetical protein